MYWNFLNRDARSKKIDLYFTRKEFVKCLDAIKKLQMISYTARDIADCYNKYGYVFNELKDPKSAYAMYRLSYSYFINENVAKLIEAFEQLDPSLKEMSADDILNLAEDNDVLIGANNKIIKAEREIASDLISNGLIEQAKALLQNDYAMTSDEEIANIYNRLIELDKTNGSEVKEEKKQDNVKKKTTAKTDTKKTTSKSTTKKVAARKDTPKVEDVKKKVVKKTTTKKEKVKVN